MDHKFKCKNWNYKTSRRKLQRKSLWSHVRQTFPQHDIKSTIHENWASSKWKTSDLQKALLGKWKEKPQTLEKYFKFICLIKDLYPEYKNYSRGFPGGAVVESLPANAGDAGSSPGLGGSHMPRSNWAREPQLLSLRVWSLCSARREAAIVRGPRTAMKSGPRLPQLEKALAQKRRPNTAINK